MPPYAVDTIMRSDSASSISVESGSSPSTLTSSSPKSIKLSPSSVATAAFSMITKTTSNGSTTTVSSSSDERKNNATNIIRIQREANKALFELEYSFYAVFDFLRKSGVSRASVDELTNQFESNHSYDSQIYATILERAQQYGECLYSCPSTSTPLSSLVVHLFVAAWECAYEYASVLYRDAYRDFHQHRRANGFDFFSNFDTNNKDNSHHSTFGYNNSNNSNSSNKDSARIARLYEKSAEDCATILRGLILVKSMWCCDDDEDSGNESDSR